MGLCILRIYLFHLYFKDQIYIFCKMLLIRIIFQQLLLKVPQNIFVFYDIIAELSHKYNYTK